MPKYEFEEKIDMVEELVFLGKFNEVITNTLMIVEYIETSKKEIDKEFKELWNEILQYIMIALENKDYLLAIDILKYELKPILKNLLKES